MTCDLYETLLPEQFHIPGLHAIISTRHGGVSTGELGRLNLGYHVQDDPTRVTGNRRRLAAAAGYDAEALIAAQQVHGTAIAVVGTAARGRGAFGWDDAIPATDGLIVADAGVPVAIQVADCAPVLLVDPAHHVLAALHAGWRGAYGRIASAAVRQLTQTFATDPVDLYAAIGPCLCAACLGVGEEVAAQVCAAFGPSVVVDDPTQPHLDLAGMVVADLLDAGVPAARMLRPTACTRCRVDRYFSHRGQNGAAGRIALVAWWDA